MTATESALQPTATLTGMEAASRWETEAIRESRDRRRARPTVSQQRTTPNPAGDWRTLREASDATGIPIGTLRKWCRRESVDSYLESDGEQTLRMLEMGSVRAHAKAMGRKTQDTRHKTQEPKEGRQTPDARRQQEESYQPPATSRQPEPVSEAGSVRTTDYGLRTTADEVGSTMIVPVDAWNKMLTQLGNLHEAGQQLAEARERAGKAETEARFLRERLAEMRQDTSSKRQEEVSSKTQVARPEGDGDQLPATSHQPDPVLSTEYSVPSAADEVGQTAPIEDATEPTTVPPAEGRGDAEERSDDAGGQESRQSPVASRQVETTSFFRYVVRGWRGRKR